MTPLSGGLNLWELDYRLDKSQSPDMLNMYWRDGSLTSRPGQEYIYEADNETFCACYDRLWNDKIIAQKGTKLYAVDPEEGTHTQLMTGLTEEKGGSFFVFGDNLYYMNGHEYVEITPSLTASNVVGYIPTTVLNRKPNGTGGDMYQPENRIAAGKTVLFTQDSDNPATVFVLPYQGLDNTLVQITANGHAYHEYATAANSTEMVAIKVKGIYIYRTDQSQYYSYDGSTYGTMDPQPTSAEEDYFFSVDRTTGVVTFKVAPTQTQIATPNNVSITCFKSDSAAVASVLSCKCATVYGGETALAVVCGGPTAQPNAYFWSGNDAAGLNPAYFPFDYYNFAGNTDEGIVAFGKQQNMLVIFKEHSIGKTAFTVTTIDERYFLQMPYYGVNDDIGCDLEGSVRLINSNLVFANTYAGVYVLLDTSAAGENAVKRLSRNINGDGLTKGLLVDLRAAAANTVSSYDDRQCYWLVANDHAYLWDYTLSSYRVSEEKLSWFYFENIGACGWIRNVDKEYYFLSNGALSQFTQVFSDYGEPIPRRYVFATQFFGTYEVLKDVLKVIFAVRSDNDPAMTITYRTDYEERQDLTKIYAYSWHLVPRNLAHRSLKPIPYAYTAVRTPRCFHIRHFTLVLTNNTVNTGMSIVSAQIIYRYSREDR